MKFQTITLENLLLFCLAFWIRNKFNLTFPIVAVALYYLMVVTNRRMSVGVIFSFWLIYVIEQHTGKGNWKNQQTYGNVLFKTLISLCLKFLFSSILLCYFLMNRLTISQFYFLPFNNSNTHKIEKEMELEILSFVLLEMKNSFYRNTSEFSLRFLSF